MITESFLRDIPPYVGSSDTSFDAALSVAGSASTMRAACLEVIASAGTSGRTCDEVESLLRWRHQTVSARLRELVLMGSIVDSGTRRPTRSNRSARVYRVTDPLSIVSGQVTLGI